MKPIFCLFSRLSTRHEMYGVLNAGVESGRKAGAGPRKIATLKRASASSLLIVPPKLVLQFDRFDLQFERFLTKQVIYFAGRQVINIMSQHLFNAT